MTYLKWVGSKAKLLTYLEPVLPRFFGDYYEPFMGSGALFFWLAERNKWNDRGARNYFLSDCNPHLVNCHMVVADHLSELKEKLTAFGTQDSKKFFLEQRQKTTDKVEIGKDVEAAARFIYLNRRAWGGMWRVNQDGMFNVPFCETQKSSLIPKVMSQCSDFLQQAQLRCCDYQDISPEEGDFVFLDPPYYPLSATSSFTGYTPGDWIEKDHLALTEFLQDLNSKGVKFLMTNTDCAFIRAHCKGFNQRSQLVIRYIDAVTHHSKKGKFSKSKRDRVNEYFVWNYDQNAWD